MVQFPVSENGFDASQESRGAENGLSLDFEVTREKKVYPLFHNGSV